MSFPAGRIVAILSYMDQIGNIVKLSCAPIVIAILFQAFAAPKDSGSAAEPQYTADGKLQFPAKYREWIFLSAGRGMTYGPSADPNGPPLFDNVFVNPAAYHAFTQSGKWPEQSIFILEVRRARSEGSINKGGQFQGDVAGIEVLVKDTRRFQDTNGWGFFEFEGGQTTPTSKLPKTAGCYACHSANAAVEYTFVQFYPTLLPIAAKHKTLNPKR